VFDIQEKVSRSIVDELELKLSTKEKQSITERPLKNVKAYECYLRAKHEIDTFTEEGLDRAIQQLKSGLEIIGESAILYAGLGYAYWQYFNIGMQEKYLNKGLEYAQKALELDPDSSEGHFVTGNLYFFHGTPRNTKKIIFHLKRALELDPNNCEALFHLEVVYLWLGKTAAVASLIEKHLSIDPLSFYGHWSKAVLHLFEGRPRQALDPMAQAYQLAPGVPPMEIFHALILACNERLEEAFSIIDQSQKTTPDHVFTQVGVFMKYALQRKREETLQSITPQMLKWGRIDFTSPGFLVEGYSLIGETEEALNWLEEWIALGCINYPLINEHDPFLENIRGEERFKKLMERVRHEWENFEV
jgi:tetratricopeptide (TPR) repeat protein